MKLEEVKTSNDLDKYNEYLNLLENQNKITENQNYELYNKAFEQVYGYPAFDEDGNFYED